jgi:translation initiation factor 5B
MNEQGRRIGTVHQIQEAGKNLSDASLGMQVAVSMKEPVIGRNINEGDIFYTDLSSREAKLLVESFFDRLNPEEREVFQFILSKKRESDPSFGYI